ncbi:MAG: hypothetical protein IJ125_08085 [Atopobiaceae bacterium]|nr:hypothetical protein [Atopobiaceae bacterium]
MKDKRFDTIARIVAFVAAAAIVFLLGNLSGRCSATPSQNTRPASSTQSEVSQSSSTASNDTTSSSSTHASNNASSHTQSNTSDSDSAYYSDADDENANSYSGSNTSSNAPPSEASEVSESSPALQSNSQEPALETQLEVYEDGHYTSKDEVALYIHLYEHLPSNFISKTKAKKAGWVASKGNLQEVCPGMSIGGSVFYNDEGKLPDAPGRTWTECDINYEGGRRGAERIVFSDDGLIFYTADHYETFTQLY